MSDDDSAIRSYSLKQMESVFCAYTVFDTSKHSIRGSLKH